MVIRGQGWLLAGQGRQIRMGRAWPLKSAEVEKDCRQMSLALTEGKSGFRQCGGTHCQTSERGGILGAVISSIFTWSTGTILTLS
jgi:hypothetical protein